VVRAEKVGICTLLSLITHSVTPLNCRARAVVGQDHAGFQWYCTAQANWPLQGYTC
jgi:hypothetical protein